MADGSFDAGPQYLIGSPGDTLTRLAIADLDNDGDADIVGLLDSVGGGDVLAWMNNGTGSFSLKIAATVGDALRDLVLADFNEDGKTDIMIVDGTSGAAFVRLGTGDGTFAAQDAWAVAVGGAGRMVDGDFNGDGHRDIAVANSMVWSGVKILLGVGDGSFVAGSDIALATVPTGLALGAFHGPGSQTLAVMSGSGASLYRLTGPGVFTAAGSVSVAVGGGDPQGLVATDLNNDLTSDLVWWNFTWGRVAITMGSPSGSFGPATLSDENASSVGGVLPFDMNGDGSTDLLLSNSSGNFAQVLLGRGNGRIGPSHGMFTTGNTPRAVAIADFNGDGAPDFVIEAHTDGVIQIAFGHRCGN